MVLSINMISSTHPCDGTLEISTDNTIIFNGSALNWYIINAENSLDYANRIDRYYAAENYDGNGYVSFANYSSGSFRIHPGAYEDYIKNGTDSEGNTWEISRRSVNLDIRAGSYYALFTYDYGNNGHKKFVFTIADSIYKVNRISSTYPCVKIAFNSKNELYFYCYNSNLDSRYKYQWVLYNPGIIPFLSNPVATGVMAPSNDKTGIITIKEGMYSNYIYNRNGDIDDKRGRLTTDENIFFEIKTESIYMLDILGIGEVAAPFKITSYAPIITTPNTTIPNTTIPNTTIPNTTIPNTTVPNTTIPNTTTPNTTRPNTTTPNTTRPNTTTPNTTRPNTTVPNTTTPNTTVPVNTSSSSTSTPYPPTPSSRPYSAKPSSTPYPSTPSSTITPYPTSENEITSTTLPPFTFTNPPNKPTTTEPIPNSLAKLHEYIAKKEEDMPRGIKSLIELRTDDSKELVMVQNNTLILGTMALAILTIGGIIIFDYQ